MSKTCRQLSVWVHVNNLAYDATSLTLVGIHVNFGSGLTYLKTCSKQEEDHSTVCGQLIAPGFVSPTTATVPGEGCHAGPFCKCPHPGQDVALGGRGQQLPGLLPL